MRSAAVTISLAGIFVAIVFNREPISTGVVCAVILIALSLFDAYLSWPLRNFWRSRFSKHQKSNLKRD